MEKLTPAAFMSYAHADDHYGDLTKFCERLSREAQVFLGREFPIFQDRKDIRWGQQWRERIEGSLDASTFLIAILSPSFFKSTECRKEVERFLEREKKLGRGDLILPVYYVDTPLMNRESARASDELAQIIAARQHYDWRESRNLPFTSPEVRRALSTLAGELRDACDRSGPHVVEPPTASRRSEPTSGAAAVSEPVARQPDKESGKTEPLTLIVDAMHRGHYATISAAIEAAQPGTRIRVRPGLYSEGLIIRKPLEIIGEGDPGDVTVQATGQDVVLFETTMGRISGLTLRQIGGGDWFGVDVAQGRLELEDCDITSESLSCVAIHAGADPRVRRNRIHDGKQSGVFVYEDGQGTLEDNDIFANALSGVAIKEGGNPTLRRNRIHDGQQGGVFVDEGGLGTLEDNDIFANGLTGVQIKDGANPTLRHNRIHDGKTGGVYMYENGQGTLEDNDIFANTFSGVQIKEGGNPVLRKNRIHGGKQSGVLVNGNGLGTLEDNDIFANARRGVEVREGGDPTLRGNRITKNTYQAVWVHTNGRGTFENNDLRGNARGAWYIAQDCLPNVKRSGNLE